MQRALLKFQIGPVQDFIAQARSTRDLWSGSYLLSWLVAAGIRKLIKQEGALIFPSQDRQPLLAQAMVQGFTTSPTGKDLTDLLTPNLPNLFIANIPLANAAELAREIEAAIREEWSAIANAVWENRAKFSLEDAFLDRFKAQVERHLSISWNVTPFSENESYQDVYRENGKILDAVRQTRDFRAWSSAAPQNRIHGIPLFQRDDLSGKEEALIGGTSYREKMEKRDGEFSHLFAKHADHLGAVQIIKRCWHLAYLKNVKNINADSKYFPIASVPDIAASRKKEDEYGTSLTDHKNHASPDSYFAAIAFDGDQIGKWVSGDFLGEKVDLQKHHQEFSTALSNFAMGAREIVEEHQGFLIYAGGDDVVALTPAHTALACAKALRKSFTNTVQFDGKEQTKPDASAGIVIAHINSPLQDAIRNAQQAEKRAKNTIGRPAFSLCLMKRSGEIAEWGAKWENHGFKLHQLILNHLQNKKLSTRFPHRICQFLAPYLGVYANNAQHTQNEKHHIAPAEIIKILEKEIIHTISRQKEPNCKPEDEMELLQVFQKYLTQLQDAKKEDPQTGKATESAKFTTPDILLALDGLCTAVAFAARTLPSKHTHTSTEDSELTHA